MTYKLEPGLSRITSPVRLMFPEGSEEYSSGLEVCEAEFDKKWRVVELRADSGTVEVVVEESDVPAVNAVWGGDVFLIARSAHPRVVIGGSAATTAVVVSGAGAAHPSLLNSVHG